MTLRSLAASESQIQSSIVAYLGTRSDCIAIKVHNEGKRSRLATGMLKRQGLLAGASDLIVLRDCGRVLLVECKTASGSLSKSQKLFRANSEALGHDYLIARSIDDVARFLAAQGTPITEVMG